MPNLFYRAGAIFGIALLAWGCSDDGVGPVPTPTLTLTPELQSIEVGQTHQLTATFVDPSNPGRRLPVIDWVSLDPAVATVSSTGAVLGVGAGTAGIVAAAEGAADTSYIRVLARVAGGEGCSAPTVTLRVGEALHVDGDGLGQLCLQGGAEYALIAANTSAGSLSTRIATSGLAQPTGSLSPSLAPSQSLSAGSASRDPLPLEFERELRRRERSQLRPAAARRSSGLHRSVGAADALEVGDLLQLNATTDCEVAEPRTAQVRYISQRAIIVADTANPSGGFTSEDYARFGATYDTLLYPVVTANFGTPATMNGENRVVIFYTRAVNELTEADDEGVVGGYFWGGDLFPKTECVGSNEREMFYLLAPDPRGTINGNVRTVDYVLKSTAGTIAHEFQHLINASRRIYLNDASEWEESWLNEGLSHIAEELVFYRRMGYAPRQNLGPSQIASTQQRLDITVQYGIANLLRLDSYLQDIDRQGPFQADDDLETRGAIWQFLRYALDRRGGDQQALLKGLVDSQTAGLENLEAVLGADPISWFVDDVVGLYADDAVTGAASEFRHPSWNYRPVLDWAAGSFALSTRTLPSGSDTSLSLGGFGTDYLRAAVPSGGLGSIRFGTGTAAAPVGLRVVVMRTR